ncbi:MAG: hypothetical protein AAB912_00750, partial [Patescibacteria group bacterium]
MMTRRLLIAVFLVSFIAGGAAGAIVTGMNQRLGGAVFGATGAGSSAGTREVVQEESAVISVVEKVSPAVVSVVIYKKLGSLF